MAVFLRTQKKLGMLWKRNLAVNRFFLAGASELETDKLGRVLMPAVLRKFGNLDKEVVWVGVGDRLEIWNSDKWNEQMMSYLEGDDVEEKIEDLASYMAELGI